MLGDRSSRLEVYEKERARESRHLAYSFFADDAVCQQMNRTRTDDQLYRQQAIKTVKRVYAKTEREEKRKKTKEL